MRKLFAVCACMIAVLTVVSIRNNSLKTGDSGEMPVVVVTATRSDAGPEWQGLLDTVVVTAVRYEQTDVAWSGLLDTVTVFEAQHRLLRGATVPMLTHRDLLGTITRDYHYRVE
jgi:hypothetical protein